MADLNIPLVKQPRVVVVGGGFGGLTFVQTLLKHDFQVVLIDRNNYHQFLPLIYQVAVSGLDASSIAFPFRKLLKNYSDCHFRMAEVLEVDQVNKRVVTSIGSLSYDYLVLGMGTTSNFFGNKEMQTHALPMKTVEEALALRNKILSNLEGVALCENKREKQALLNVVVVGGGATGVEVSGVLSELKRFVIPEDYRDIGELSMNIYLVEASGFLLSALSEVSSGAALRFLTSMGVKVLLNKKVVSYDGAIVCLDDQTMIETKTVIWVSGVKAESLMGIPETSLARGGRIQVDGYNEVIGLKDIFAIGDIAYQIESEAYPCGHPQLAQVAMQQGRLLAENLMHLNRNEERILFRYKNLGALATVGRNKAVAEFPHYKMQGFGAWAIWMFVHLRSILGVKNKLKVLIEWMWSYFTYDSVIGLILFNCKRSDRS